MLQATSLNQGKEWEEAWKRYMDNSKDKWNIPSEPGVMADYVPQSFKDLCQEKAKEEISGEDDPRYSDITSYCSRPKTLSEVFQKEDIKLLGTDQNEAQWKTKFEKYKKSDKQIPSAEKANLEDQEAQFIKLRDGCKKGLEAKTTDDNYQKTYDAVKEWCQVEQ